jgi:hypothetical protein
LRFSAPDVLIALPKGFINALASEFPCGQSGVDVWCFTPSFVKYSLNSLLLNGGPLSDLEVNGMPCMSCENGV